MNILNKEEKKVLNESVIKIIKDKNFTFLETVMKDRRPQIPPIWIDIEDNSNIILINKT